MIGRPIDGRWRVEFSYGGSGLNRSVMGHMVLMDGHIHSAADETGARYTGTYTLNRTILTFEVAASMGDEETDEAAASMGDDGTEPPIPGLTYPFSFSMEGWYEGLNQGHAFSARGKINEQFPLKWSAARYV